MSEYYHDKAMEFIRDNWFALPRLLLGKLIRSFVPVPWVPLAASYLTFFFRACVYAAFAASLWIWRSKNVAYSILVGAMFLVTLATTLIYYGSFRFAFCVEPFLFPFIGGAAVSTARMLGRKLARSGGCAIDSAPRPHIRGGFVIGSEFGLMVGVQAALRGSTSFSISVGSAVSRSYAFWRFNQYCGDVPK